LLWIILYWKGEKLKLPDQLDEYALVIGLTFLITTWIGVLLIRFIGAPVRLEAQARNEAATHLQIIESYQRRLTPKIRLFLEDGGIHDFPCENGSVSRYVQITVTPATDEALIGCEARVESVARINIDGSVEEFPEEQLHFGWANCDALQLDIKPRIKHRINLFWVNDADETELRIETRPAKFRLPLELQEHGDYRIVLNVAAANVPTLNATYRFHWGGFDDVSLEPL
jgi:hypothetical protein